MGGRNKVQVGFPGSLSLWSHQILKVLGDSHQGEVSPSPGWRRQAHGVTSPVTSPSLGAVRRQLESPGVQGAPPHP